MPCAVLGTGDLGMEEAQEGHDFVGDLDILRIIPGLGEQVTVVVAWQVSTRGTCIMKGIWASLGLSFVGTEDCTMG